MNGLHKIICSCCSHIVWTAFDKGIDKCDACENARTCPPVSHSVFEDRRLAIAR